MQLLQLQQQVSLSGGGGGDGGGGDGGGGGIAALSREVDVATEGLEDLSQRPTESPAQASAELSVAAMEQLQARLAQQATDLAERDAALAKTDADLAEARAQLILAREEVRSLFKSFGPIAPAPPRGLPHDNKLLISTHALKCWDLTNR